MLKWKQDQVRGAAVHRVDEGICAIDLIDLSKGLS
jgi:hypothetical protein